MVEDLPELRETFKLDGGDAQAFGEALVILMAGNDQGGAGRFADGLEGLGQKLPGSAGLIAT